MTLNVRRVVEQGSGASAPSAERQAINPNATQEPRFKNLEERFKSFHGVPWKRNIAAQPEALAKAGLYYVGPGDKVRCAYCWYKFKHWTVDKQALDTHCALSPNCSFVKTIEKQRNILSQGIRSKVQSTHLSISEELMKQKREQKKRTTEAAVVKEDSIKATLRKLCYRDSVIAAAEERLRRQGKPRNLDNMMAELQRLEKEEHFGCAMSLSEIRVSPNAEEEVKVEPESVSKIRAESEYGLRFSFF